MGDMTVDQIKARDVMIQKRDAPTPYPRMLFKAPGEHAIHGGKYDTNIVESAAAETEALAQGWFLTTPEAKADLAERAAHAAQAKQVIEDAKTVASAKVIAARPVDKPKA